MRFPKIIPLILQALLWLPLQPFLRVFAGLTVEGLENLARVSGPVIFASNHPSQMDPFVFRAALPFFSRFSPICWIIRTSKTYAWTGWRKYIFWSPLLSVLGGVIAPAGLHDYAKTLAVHKRLIEKGRYFCIFPQAGDDKFFDENAPVHGGIGYLVSATNATVVPVAIIGTKGLGFLGLLKNHHTIKVVFGKSVPSSSLTNSLSEQVSVEGCKAIAQKIVESIRSLGEKSS